MIKQNILVDCDGVLANCVEFITEYLSNKYNVNFNTPEYQEKDFRDWPQYSKADEEYFQSAGLCLNFKATDGSHEFINELNKRDLDVIICTSPYRGSDTWASDRTKWLKKEYGIERKNIIFAATGMKKYISGITLIDDHPTNCTTWSEHNHKASILVEQPWNKSFIRDSIKNPSWKIDCAQNYKQILSIIDHRILS